jgi:mono/diheme cytochrome c family protein
MAANQAPSVRANAKNSLTTQVTGESWLSHLNRQFGETSMGKTGHLGPPPPVPGDIPPRGQPRLLIGCATQTMTLHGADLYRLNCRGCHGEAGLGAPPEINSIISPVQATSVQLVLERMKKLGGDMSRAQVVQLAQQAQATLVQRLHGGGKSMPPFPYLNDAEVRSIMAYLRQLADIPGAEKEQVVVSEPPVRVGELIVKSTCHICHSAAGPNPSPEQLLNGAIPPLETLTTRKDQSGLVQKVTQGAPILMGEPPMLYRGRMPVFHYLTPDEAADAYLYLTLYPPSELAILDPVATTSQPNGTLIGIDHAEPIPGAQAGSNNGRPEVPRLDGRAGTQQVALFLGLGLLVAALGAGGLGFSLWVFKRLSSKNERRALAARDARVSSDVARPLVVVKEGPCRTLFRGSKGRRPDHLFADEVGDLTRKKTRGGRQCHGARLG